ncbi:MULTISPECIES: DUF4907 domain-containing protein [Leptospira]|uniref:DUF4907 domain-containing protein n=4 Tax=Leptospira weilii TaxID=28184 RepID=A0A828YWX8_9LEPT|nr:MULTISPECIES: DUF4907 domain-containing protein [Leptospira]EMM72747.1 hypothetical protein LEP1GSC038_1861 [Leptospira weilii str. 2006001855]EMY12185.1 hypothetical protein LEP1GSC043_1477 [Leptospira weilii str. Ecochallenge]EKR62057.1 hypothetical protein LEP1GSC036_0031 [Leptospira weilii str. 2006001853]EMJ66151.1 hypothetical protein LEP1GSC051_1238 [Leptospira sp. P2653]EMN43777.1 hypothetical protein LEP1GSC086_4602 [Leptospira weilii str. LNT 1234]
MKEKILILLCLCILNILCKPHKTEENQQASGKFSSYTNAKIRIQTFDVNSGEYGYDVYVDGSRFVHQPHIPGRHGTEGFQNQKQAERVATLVSEKIRKGLIPPTITREEVENAISHSRN